VTSPIIDFHQHLWPDGLVALLSRRTTPPFLRGDVLRTVEGSFEIDLAAHQLSSRLAALDRVGIERAVVSLQPTLGIHLLPIDEAQPLIDAYHEGALELAKQSRGRIIPLSVGVTLDGFAGACVPARFIWDERTSLLVADLVERNQFLFVHPGPAEFDDIDEDWWAPVVDYTAQMQSAYAAWLACGAERWPSLPVVFAILAGGAPFQLERFASRGVDTTLATRSNTYFDTASYGRLALEFCLAAFGLHRLVYGSDSPVIEATPPLDAIQTLGKEAVDAICSRNALALLV
jgi:Amidohydrolase